MIAKLKQQPAIRKALTQYNRMPSRDQKAVQLLALAIILVLIYALIWRPVSSFREHAEQRHENAESLLAWAEANQGVFRELAGKSQTGAAPAQTISDTRQLMAVVTQSAGDSGLSLQRFEPSGEKAMRVWLGNVPFRDVASWLERLNTQYGIVIDQAALDKEEGTGQISARLTLEVAGA